MNTLFRGFLQLFLFSQLFSVTVMAAEVQKPVPTVHFDRVQGIVNRVQPDSSLVEISLVDGSTQRIRIASNAWLHSLRGLDERARRLDPKGIESFKSGARIAASGLVYSDRPELMAKEVTFFTGGDDNKLLFEDADWWSSQATQLAEFWIRTQFGSGDIGDPAGYRTKISKTGTKRPEKIPKW